MSDDISNIDVDKIVRHWIDTSDEDFQTMLSLYDSKSYGWALFWDIYQLRNCLRLFM